MIMLMLEGSWLIEALLKSTEGNVMHGMVKQFTHHPWHGLYFWDLIQPGFMFIAGTAMAFSLYKRKEEPWNRQLIKALKRSGWLFFWGVLDYAVTGEKLSFELWNVLTQLSFTLLLAFLIFRWKIVYQVAVTVVLLLFTEILYRYTNIPGFDQPFTDRHNFGNYADLLLMNKINSDGWVAINCIPTAVHTIMGAVAGKVLLRNIAANKKLLPLIMTGVGCVVGGLLLDASSITPIIKRTATSSFVLVSGGISLIALSFLYWWIDVLNHRKGLKFFTIVGMNSIFIYLFMEIVSYRWFNGYIMTICKNLLSYAGVPVMVQTVVGALIIFSLLWGICYFLYRRKIFFKL